MTDIRTSKIFLDESTSITNRVIDGNDNSVHIMRGTTSERPSTGIDGDMYYDTEEKKMYNYTSLGWQQVSQDPPPQISTISPTTAPVSGTLITINGSNFKPGLSVQFIGSNSTSYSSPVSTYISSTSSTATTPQLPVEYEPYDVKLINVDNQYALLDNCLDAGALPSWNTSAGLLTTVNGNTTLSGVSVSATDPDGTQLVYSSSNLPSWISINSSTGALTGTSPSLTSQTTYTFTVSVTDGTNSSSRSFSISVRGDVVTTGLVTHLDASKSASYSSGSIWYDLSGNGNNASINGGASHITSGTGGHFRLDGSSGYFQLASNSSAAPYANQNFSIDFWLNRYSATDGYEILWSQDYTTHAPPYYSVHIRIDNDPGSMNMSGGVAVGSGNNASIVTTGDWAHWVFTRDQSTGIATLYKNGVQVYQNTGQGSTINYYSNPLWVGKSNFNASSTLDFASIRYYNRALTSSEVTQNFDATKARFGF